MHELVMENSEDILNTERNITGDQFCFLIDTTDELCKKKTRYIGTIIPNRKGLQVALKREKGCQVLSLEFKWKKIAQL